MSRLISKNSRASKPALSAAKRQHVHLPTPAKSVQHAKSSLPARRKATLTHAATSVSCCDRVFPVFSPAPDAPVLTIC